MGPRKARERTGQPEKLSRLKALMDEIYNDIQTKEKGATDKEFLIEHDLEKIWTSERLTPFLECADISVPEDVFSEARDNFKKILSILVEIGWPAEEWHKFKQHIWEQVDSEGNRSRADANLPFSADHINFLDSRCRKSFLSAQYKFIPICIKESVHNRHDAKLRLPFVNTEVDRIGNGGYGVVTKEVIACRQFLYATKSKNEDLLEVACKHFKQQGERGPFQIENQNLSTLRDALSKNHRIVGFLATVSIGEDCFIISPLADMSLHKFLYEEGSREFTISMVNLITEASYLADALDFLHEHIRIEVPGKSSQLLACCHMDLKPDNILVFRRPRKAVGIWMITDFGISTLKENTSSQAKGKNQLEVPTTVGMIAQTTKTGAKREKGTFQAPEVNEIDVENFRSVGRKSDIWSFGCILVLLIAFGSDGLKELEEHDRKRLQGSFTPNDEGSNDFFYSKSDESSQWIVNPAVKGFIDDLAGYGSLRNDNMKFDYKKCSKLLLQILNPTSPQKRPDAKIIHEELNSIVSPPSKQNSSSSTQGAGHKGKGKARSGSTSSNAESLDHVRSHSSQSGERSVRPTLFEENKKPDLGSSVSPSRASSSRSNQSLTLAHNMGGPSHEFTPLRNESTSNTPRLTVSPLLGSTLGHIKRPSGSVSLTRINEDQLPEPPNPTERSRHSEHFGAIQTQQQRAPPTPPDEPTIASSSVPNQKFVTSMPNTQEAKIDSFKLTTEKNPKGLFLSSSGDRVALLYENEVHVHFLEGIRHNFQIPKLVKSELKELKWNSACLAGSYLCLKGVYGKRQDLFACYHVPPMVDNSISSPEIYRRSSLISIEVSQQGNILFEDSHGVKLGYKQLSANSPVTSLLILSRSGEVLVSNQTISGSILRAWFGASGKWAFIWTQRKGRQCVHIFDTANPNDCKIYTHHIKDSSSVDAIKDIISFPDSRGYVLWERNDYVSIIRTPEHALSPSRKKFSDLKAIAIAPKGDVLIFIRKQEVWISSITSKIGEMLKVHKLKKKYEEKENNSAVAVRASTSHRFTIVVGHINGQVEEISL